MIMFFVVVFLNESFFFQTNSFDHEEFVSGMSSVSFGNDFD